MTVARRSFLKGIAGVAAWSAAAGSLGSWTRDALAATAPDLIERNDWPEHWETTLGGLGRSWITANERFFVRSHFPVPALKPESWRLEVTGLVRKPLTLSLADLRAMPVAEQVHTLECAGNGRGLYALANTSGTQWERGAVGNATWTGVRLSSLLERAGVAPEARHVWFEAADHATLPETPPFLRSIPLEKASKDTLLAWGMNGAPLPAAHGGPLRAVVPGWFGMAWAKWVTRVRVEAAPSDNHFMVRGYRYVYPGADPAQAPPVEEMVVKSVITAPLEGQRLRAGRIRVQGFAWAGTPEVAKVEVSADSGRTWNAAGFVGKSTPHAWRSFAADVEMRAGRQVIMARATDAAGRTQPAEAKPNASGYANNSIHVVTVHAG